MKMIIVPNKSRLKPCVSVLCEENADPDHPPLALACLMPCQNVACRACANGRLCLALSCCSDPSAFTDPKGQDPSPRADPLSDNAITDREKETVNPDPEGGSNGKALVLTCLYGLPPQRRRLRKVWSRRSDRFTQNRACAVWMRPAFLEAHKSGQSLSCKSLEALPHGLEDEPPYPLEREGFRQALAEALQEEQKNSDSFS
jgi:hypothetical protein